MKITENWSQKLYVSAISIIITRFPRTRYFKKSDEKNINS